MHHLSDFQVFTALRQAWKCFQVPIARLAETQHFELKCNWQNMHDRLFGWIDDSFLTGDCWLRGRWRSQLARGCASFPQPISTTHSCLLSLQDIPVVAGIIGSTSIRHTRLCYCSVLGGSQVIMTGDNCCKKRRTMGVRRKKEWETAKSGKEADKVRKDTD